MQHDTTLTTVSLPSALVEVRGPSGRLYGELDIATGVIIFRRGKVCERIDLSLYFKAAKIKREEYQGS